MYSISESQHMSQSQCHVTAVALFWITRRITARKIQNQIQSGHISQKQIKHPKTGLNVNEQIHACL